MRKHCIKVVSIGLLLLSMVFVAFTQTRNDKTLAIINKLNLIENQKTNFQFQIEALKYQAKGNDSIKISELEKQLTDEEIVKRLTETFTEMLSDAEINDLYEFLQSSAFEKFFSSGEMSAAISDKFSDINSEIERISNNFGKSIEKPTKKFQPIPVDRENGFYAAVGYKNSMADKDVLLEETPSLTTRDILEVKKVFSTYSDRSEISIVFTKEGARKFYLLTKENIGKPVAIVIDKHIVSIPKVLSEIVGGKASISGDFSEDEIDQMIEILKRK